MHGSFLPHLATLVAHRFRSVRREALALRLGIVHVPVPRALIAVTVVVVASARVASLDVGVDVGLRIASVVTHFVVTLLTAVVVAPGLDLLLDLHDA